MAEYIEREALIQRLENSPLFTNFGEDGYFIGNGVIEIIKRQPIMNSSADVVEVRHEHWDENIIGFCNVCMGCGAIVERTAIKNRSGELNYCPNCGAKMDRKEQDNEQNQEVR